MLIHLLLLGWIIMSGLYIYSTNKIGLKSKNKLFLFISFLFILLIASLRDTTVGLDTQVYISAYHRINENLNSWEKENWEKGYVILNILIGKISNNNEQIYLACVAAIILIGVGCFIIKNADNISAFFPVFLFVTLNHYLTSMVSLRQYTALAIGINSYTILKQDISKKSLIKSIILILLAMFFHKSALVLFIIPILFSLKNVNKKTIIISAIVGLIVYVFFFELMDFVMGILPGYSRYIINGNLKFQGVPFSNTYKVLLLLKIIVLILVFKQSPSLDENRELYILLALTVISSIISFLTMKVALVWRFGYYFDIFLIIFIPKAIKKIQGIPGFTEGCILLIGTVYYIYLLVVNTAGCVPYSFFSIQ